MKAYSKDLRERVLRALDQGHPRAEIVTMFGVSLATLKRYLKQRRETGDLSPKAIPGRPSQKYAALEAGLVAQLEAHRDITLEAHCRLWESTHGMWVDHTTMSRAIRRVGWTRKKSRWVPLSATRRSVPLGERK
jgi:transposase